jgi:hypothetical protein
VARWLVKLDGERADLEEFPQSFPDGELYAIEKDGNVYLTGEELERLTSATEVRECATGAGEAAGLSDGVGRPVNARLHIFRSSRE